MAKFNTKNKIQLKDLIQRFPLRTDTAISKEVGCSIKTVGVYRKEIDEHYDTEFVQIVAGKWIKYYGLAAELFFKYIGQLEGYKDEQKIIGEKENGDPIKVPLSPVEKGQLTRIQADILTKLLEDAGNGEVREVIRMMRNGKVPSIT